MNKYLVKFAVRSDGKRYAVGDRLELSNAVAAPLLAVGAIALATPEKAEEKEPAKVPASPLKTEKPTA